MRTNWILTAGVCLTIGVAVLAQQQPAGSPAEPQEAAAKKKRMRVPKPGVSTPGVKREIATIAPAAVFDTGGTPDWQVLTEDSLWVANGPLNSVHRLDLKTNTIAATITVGKRPCSGLTEGFGSVWSPSCGDHTLTRIDEKTNTVTATIPVGPGESEGGIAASKDAIWLVSDPAGKLSRIDPKTNAVAATIDIPEKSAAVYYADGAVWVTSPEKNTLTRVDAETNQVTDTIEVGPGPRFETAGAGSIWTLNQGNGTVSRVDTKTRKVVATVECGIPGTGGEIAFGFGHVWATIFTIPITEIDPQTNTVVRQWTGDGGDSIRAGHESVFLSNLRAHNVWRIDHSKM
ncbi:MAG: hypothetical protein KGN84_17955 [Acidobacteriota bacterium]|nr:hypothetical protein [Acidobacteriota bacterium]